MGSTATIPMLSLDGGLTHYLTEIRKFPMLRPDEDVLCKALGQRIAGDPNVPTSAKAIRFLLCIAK